MSENNEGLAKLRAPFEPHQINQLPKAITKGGDRFQCRQGTQASADGKYCGGYHARSVHLDYVGHAALTDRLLEVDPEWDWVPLALNEAGLPAFDNNGGLWIKLTICGTTRLGYGDSQGKSGGNAVKEAIGDALRNAGMRFGAALDLWHRGDLHDAKEEQGKLDTPEEPQTPPTTIQRKRVSEADLNNWKELVDGASTKAELLELHKRATADGAPNQVLAAIVAKGERAA